VAISEREAEGRARGKNEEGEGLSHVAVEQLLRLIEGEGGGGGPGISRVQSDACRMLMRAGMRTHSVLEGTYSIIKGTHSIVKRTHSIDRRAHSIVK
jgi:hypothetical protein